MVTPGVERLMGTDTARSAKPPSCWSGPALRNPFWETSGSLVFSTETPNLVVWLTMQVLAGRLLLSATDLVNFLECRHATYLDLRFD